MIQREIISGHKLNLVPNNWIFLIEQIHALIMLNEMMVEGSS